MCLKDNNGFWQTRMLALEEKVEDVRVEQASTNEKLKHITEKLDCIDEKFSKYGKSIYGNGEGGLYQKIDHLEIRLTQIEQAKNRIVKALWTGTGGLVLFLLKEAWTYLHNRI